MGGETRTDARPEREYDAIVVGSGPGGATAARQLCALGCDVLVIDRAEFPREKLCGGLLTDKTVHLLERVFGADVGALHDRGVVDFRADEYAAYFDDERVVREPIDTPFYFVDRAEYDAYLHRAAVRAGADTHLGDGVRRVDPAAGTVETVDGERFSARYLVGADGASSRVRTQLADWGLIDDDGWSDDLAIAVEAYVPREETALDLAHPVLHFGILEWGYGWVFPNTDRLVIGVGGLNEKTDRSFRAVLDEYLDLLGVDRDPDVVNGHPIPFGNYLARPGHGRTLLVGDAAGTADAISGEGIFYAQRTGELAAHAIAADAADTTAAERYVAAYREYVAPELRGSRLARVPIWAGPKAPRKLAMKLWFAGFSEPTVELIHGERIYRLLRPRGDRVHRGVPSW